MDFRNAFDAFSIVQNVSTEGLVVRESWALEIADVETKLTPRTGGEETVFHSTTVTHAQTAVRRGMEGRSCSWRA
jgi:hypothetical protein